MANGKVLFQVIGLGAVAGMRASLATAITSNYLRNHPNPAISRSMFRFMQMPVTAVTTQLVSAAEISNDKMPGTPDRIEPSQVAARVLSGAFVGATIAKANRESILTGMLLGGASALAVTFGSFFLRQYVEENTHLTDPVAGAFEDAFAIGSGVSLMKI
ncbi:DUF4126 family protein [Mucilaginibacter pallidiroseus]|uniref:DUF4126 family protein n=1 Tax=Mucilaginibacter pallidiroseus TaxID=2599295 RepID=A0A563U539_9SPHI|nr:DUF4126 family protein [Mucilaginibacter pallidiroseus]TWR26448.1 DUF4126 family protein [Mucilaginibacter pallidiroseus]